MAAHLSPLQSLDLVNTTQVEAVVVALMVVDLMEMDLAAEFLVVAEMLFPKETSEEMASLEESYFLFLPLAILES